MLLLEQYIEKRKHEDGLDEFDTSKKIDNIHICINYIFEYFNQYLPIQGAEERTPKENKLLNKYENSIRLYSNETQAWLCQIYCETGHKLNMTLERYLHRHPEYFLFYQEHEIRNISYNYYAEIVKKSPYVKNRTEELYRIIKEYHDIICSYDDERDNPNISCEFSKWLRDTWKKYNVNLVKAAGAYVEEFMNNQAWWPPGTRIKTGSMLPEFEYMYDETKARNRFGINEYFGRYGDRPFLKGKKRHLELLMLHSWNSRGEEYKKLLEENSDL